MLWGYVIGADVGIKFYNGRFLGVYAYGNYPHITFFEADTNLNIIWKRTYTSADTTFRWGGSARVKGIYMDDNGYIYTIYVGRMPPYYFDYPVVLKFDTLGNLIWWKLYNWDNVETRFAYKIPSNLIKNGLIVGGAVYPEGWDTTWKSHMAVMKIDTSGGVVWAKTYGRDVRILGFAASVVPTDSIGSGYYLIGAESDLILGRLDANGNQIWFKKYISSDYIAPALNSTTIVGDKLIFGSGDGSAYNLIKIDTTGIPHMRKYIQPYTLVEADLDRWEWRGGYIYAQFRLVAFDTNFNLLRDTAINRARVLENLGGWYVARRSHLGGYTILKVNSSLQTCDDTITKEYIYTVSATMPSVIDYTDSLIIMDWTTRINTINIPFLEVLPDTITFEPYCSIKITENLKEPKSKTIEIYDVSGRLIYKGGKKPNLERGVYFIRRDGKVFKEIRR